MALDQAKVQQLKDYIGANKDTKGKLMPIMQKAQEIFGYVGEDVQTVITETSGIPIADLYGVATFYTQFALKPKGKHIIGVCMGTACYVRDSQKVLDALIKELDVPVGDTTQDGLFTLEATRCLGCCGLAPVIMIDDDVYGRLTADEIPAIIAKYRV